MEIIRTSILTGQTHRREINVNAQQIQRWEKGELIQNVCPHLTKWEREFIISGTTEEEWAAITTEFDDPDPMNTIAGGNSTISKNKED